MTDNEESGAALSPLALFAGMSGNLMEWYDFALYGVLSDRRVVFLDGLCEGLDRRRRTP